MNAYLYSQLPLAAGFCLLLILASVRPEGSPATRRLSLWISLAAVGLTALITGMHLHPGDEFFGGAIRVTVVGKVLAVSALVLALGALVLANGYLEKIRVRSIDFRMVALAQAFGLVHLPLAGDVATLFIAFELVSIPSYVLAGFNFRDTRGNEAGMKYLILGAFASVFLLLGIAFLYGVTGELHLAGMRDAIGGFVLEGAVAELILAKMALALVLAALMFKIAAAPFHFWISDIYQGTNLASLSFISVPAKVALFAAVAVLLWGPFMYLSEVWMPVVLVVALASALFGNIQTIVQTDAKRILAYSSVGNGGFVLLALFLDSASAFLFYLVAYSLTTLGVIAGFMALGTKGADLSSVSDFDGLGRRNPWVAALLTWMIFGLAGVPLTAGFAAKFAVITGAFTPGFEPMPWFLPVLFVSVVLSLISFFFYFGMVRAMWFVNPPADAPHPSAEPRALHPEAVSVLAFCAVATLALGVMLRLPVLP